MEKKLLTSVVVLGFVMPAMADFPSNGLMQENQIYANAATEGNILVTEGSVYANAEYEDDSYNLLPGTYLPENSNDVADCLSGSYCPGASVVYNGSAQGITQCPSGYNSSDSGASSVGQCYRTCSSAAHAASMTGNDYYGFSADTCEAATCVAGWHTATGVSNNFAPYLDAVGDVHAVTSSYVWNGQYYNRYDSQYYGNLGGCDSSVNSSCENSGSSVAEDSMTRTAGFYDMLVDGEWAVGYGYYHGFVRGTARVASVDNAVVATASTPPTVRTTAQLGNGSGTGCWCNITGYRVWMDPSVSPEATQWDRATSSWAYVGQGGPEGECALRCATSMAENDAASISFRSALLGTVQQVSSTYCAANSITINWNGVGDNKKADGTNMSNYSSTNHTGNTVVSYSGSIVAPRTPWAPVGKRFKGWRFSTTAPAE